MGSEITEYIYHVRRQNSKPDIYNKYTMHPDDTTSSNTTFINECIVIQGRLVQINPFEDTCFRRIDSVVSFHKALEITAELIADIQFG